MTIYRKLCAIYDEHLHELRNEKEKLFVEDMFDGLLGVSNSISDVDLDEYLSPRQVGWINDIAVYLGIE